MSKVDDIISERRSRYGSFLSQATVSVKIKEIMQATPNWEHLDPDQREALEMWAVKASRILTGNKDYPDNWRDVEGYAKLVADRMDALEVMQKSQSVVIPAVPTDYGRIDPQWPPVDEERNESDPSWPDKL